MPNNIFISGLPKSGKTTALRRLIRELESNGYALGGFISPEIKERGTREGFYIEEIASGKTAMLASISGEGPRVSKYHVDVKGFEGIALDCLRNAKKYDVLVIDEIGRIELESVRFGDMLEEVLRGPVMVIASLHNDFVREYENFGTVYNMTDTNRNAVEIEVLNNVLKILGKRKKIAERAKPKEKPMPDKQERPEKTEKGPVMKPEKKRIRKTPKIERKKPLAKKPPVKPAAKKEGKEGEKKKGFWHNVKRFFQVA